MARTASQQTKGDREMARNSQPTDKRRSNEVDRGRDRDGGRADAKETREMPPPEMRRTSTRDVPTDKVLDREPNSASKSGDNNAPSAGKVVLKKSTSGAKDPLSVRYTCFSALRL